MSDKVFCGDCWFYEVIDCDMGCVAENCRASRDSRCDYSHRWIEYGNPQQINKENKCKLYKPSRWFVFKEKLTFCLSACSEYKDKVVKWLKYPLTVIGDK